MESSHRSNGNSNLEGDLNFHSPEDSLEADIPNISDKEKLVMHDSSLRSNIATLSVNETSRDMTLNSHAQNTSTYQWRSNIVKKSVLPFPLPGTLPMADTRIENEFFMQIFIKKAEKLTSPDYFRSDNDPYCKIYLNDNKATKKVTSIKFRTLNPIWNEKFDFERVNSKDSLIIKVYDQNIMWKDRFLGMIRLSLDRFVPKVHIDEPHIRSISKDLSSRPEKPSPVSGRIFIKLIFFNMDVIRPYLNMGQVASSPSRDLSGPLFHEQLPAGWETSQDSTGRQIYICHVDQSVHYQRPSSTPTSTNMQHSTSCNNNIKCNGTSTGLLNHQMRHSTSMGELEIFPFPAPKDDSFFESQLYEKQLPEGYDMGVTAHGRVFFIHHQSRTTQWQDPRLDISVSPHKILAFSLKDQQESEKKQTGIDGVTANPSSSLAHPEAFGETTSALPAGWESRRTQKGGRMYFVDLMRDKAQWEDPRLTSDKYGLFPMSTMNGDHSQHGSDAKRENANIQSVNSSVMSSYLTIERRRTFRQKLYFFRSRLKLAQGKFEVKVTRASLFEDAFRLISSASPVDLQRRLVVNFDGEDGLDYGGLAREFFYFLSHAVFNPYYGLFEYAANDNYTLQIHTHSDVNPQHLQYFYFVGRIIGMAVFHGKLMDVYFIPLFYKQILRKDITLQDMLSIDIDFYHSMTWMLENSVHGLHLTFSVDVQRYGSTLTYEFVPNGANILVTDENKLQYIKLYIAWRSERGTQEQMRAFLKGFHELVPLELLRLFDERELEFLISGLSEFDMEDWKQHTNYKNYSPHDEVIEWFWEAVSSFDNEQKALLLMFVTGTSHVPATGFRDLQGSDGPRRFCIERVGDEKWLPKSHTCFNRLDLPPYSSYDMLLEKLKYAIEHTRGFGIE